SSTPDAAPDAVWFFPLMSVAGPALLEAVLGRFRRWFQRDTGRRGKATPTFGWRRWTPGLGACRDTYGAYRTALLLGVDTCQAAAGPATPPYPQLGRGGARGVAAARGARHATQAQALPAPPDNRTDAQVPVDLMRRIPVDQDRYRRWLEVWADLRHGATDLTE